MEEHTTELTYYKTHINQNITEITNCKRVIAEYENECNRLDEELYNKKNNIQKQIDIYYSKIIEYKSSIININEIITNIIGYKLDIFNIDILLLLFNYIVDGNIILNLLSTNKLFNNLIKNDYPNYILLYNKSNCIHTITIPKHIFTSNNITIEQIFYVPLTEEGRTIIHLCARTNDIMLLLSIYKMFPYLNINCLTIVEQWHPLHNAINIMSFDMCIELLKIGVDKNYHIQNPRQYSISDMISEFYTKTDINAIIQYELIMSINTYTDKTQFDYDILFKYPDIINILQTLYYLIKNKNSYNSIKIINL